MRNNYWNAITLALGACAVPHLIGQVNLDPSRPIASAVLSGNANPATYGKVGNLNWDTTQAATHANLNSITQFSGNPDVQKLMSIFETARAEYIKLDKDLTTARVELDAKQAKYNSDPSAANAQSLELAVKAESDLNKKMDTQNQILSAVAPVVTIKSAETIASGGQRPLVLGENKGVVDRATETAQNEPSYRAITGSVSNYVAGIKGTSNLESIITTIKTSTASGQRPEDANGDGFDDKKQANIEVARADFNKAPDDVSKLINYAQKVQESFNDYKPVTDEFKANVMGEVLNGSWERNAINDIAGKGGLIQTETAQRTAGDTALDAKIDGEVNDRKAVDTALGAKIDGEISDRKAVDTALDAKIDGEITDRRSAVAAAVIDANQYTDKGVAAAKQYSDAGDLKTLNASKTFTLDQVAAESQARVTAVRDLDVKMSNEISKEAEERIAAIKQEAQERVAAIQKEENARIADIKRIDNKFTEQVDGLGRRIFKVEDRVTQAESMLADHETRLFSAEQNIQQLQRGIAMTAALQTPVIDHGSNNAMKFSMANYGGENGFSIGYARRLFKGFSADVEAASTSQFEEAVVRGGINFSW